MRFKFVVATVVAIVLAASGCSVGQGAQPDSDTIKVGAIPVSDFVPVYVAMDRGFFEDEGLDVEVQTMENAAAIVPAVMNGQLQVGATANVPYLTAKAKGLPLLALGSGANTSGVTETDFSGLFVAEDSAIERPRDLEGKTVTTNNLQNVLQLAVAQSVRADGGDPEKVQFVAMPFPNMVPALSDGSVDAISVVEPFYSAAQGSGATLLDNPYATAYPADTTLAFFFSSQQWLEEHPENAAKFADALNRAGAYAAEHPDAVRDALVEHLNMDPEVAAEMRLPRFGTQVSADSLSGTAELMAEFGFIDEVPDSGGLVWQP